MTTEMHRHNAHCWWNAHEARWECVATTTTDTDRPLVDVRDMIVVHTAMLREFRLAPAAIAQVEAGDAKRAAVIDRHLDLLCDMLHHHHQGEDELLWPLLRDRVPADARRLIDEVESQHLAIDAALQTVSAARSAWLGRPDADNRGALIAALEHLHELLKRHLDLEESAVLPLAAGVLTDDEWHAIGEAAAAAMSKSVLMLVFGMFAYEGDPVVLRGMLASAPAVPRLLIPRVAPRVYARRARQLYGTSRP